MQPGVVEHRSDELPGRSHELASLLRVLEPDGPDVISVHGIGGIGKTALVEHFADLARDRGTEVVQIDARRLAPTPIGLLTELADQFGLPTEQGEAGIAARLRAHVDAERDGGGDRRGTVLVVDNLEVLPLLDTWIRQGLVPTLVPAAGVVLVGREPLHPAWQSLRLQDIELASIEVGPLCTDRTIDILHAAGVPDPVVPRLVELTGGHPMSIWIAVDALSRAANRPIDSVLPRLNETIAALHLDGLDPSAREAVEALAVVRRGTASVFAAMLPDHAPGDLIGRVARLPFVERRPDGLALHDAVREAITGTLEATDPIRHAELRRRAWHQIRHDIEHDPTPDTWRYTADLLYLIENPLIRDGFFPATTSEHRIEPAGPAHFRAISDLIADQPDDQRALLTEWARACPEAWRVAIDRSNRVAGCALVVAARDVPASLKRSDPVVAAFDAHRRSDAVPPGHHVLYVRAWLSDGLGERPSSAQAALWLDCKRTYLDRRHTMRRVYVAVEHLDIFLPALEPLGFRHVAEVESELAARHVLLVDFGPGGVNGWLAEIGSRELGIERRRLLDPDDRTLRLGDADIALTPLEFGVLDQLVAAGGKPVSRADLIERVWGHTYAGGSNVVDAVVRTLRRKMGRRAIEVETVRGVGYRHAPA